MTNVEALEDELDAVRKRLGWEEGQDTAAVDARINDMTAMQVTKKWVGWVLGDEDWAPIIVHLYKRMEEAGVE